MKFQFWSIGKAHEAYVKTGVEDFTKRISHYYPVEWTRHVGHDVHKLIITSHGLLKFFRKLGGVAGFTNKSVVNNNHN